MKLNRNSTDSLRNSKSHRNLSVTLYIYKDIGWSFNEEQGKAIPDCR